MEKEIVIRYRDKQVNVIPTGPSLWGYIYSSPKEQRYYRLLHKEDVPKFSIRKEIEECIGKPQRQGIAPIVDEGDAFIGNRSFYCIVYETGGVSLSGIIAEAEKTVLLYNVARIFDALENAWQEEIRTGLYLMPADIIMHHNHPWLLRFPVGTVWPRYEALMEYPERIACLPPEIIRGNRFLVRDINRAFYSCGVLLALSMFDIQFPANPAEFFRLASTGSLYDKNRNQFKLPYWIEKTDFFKNTLEVLNTAVHPDPRIRANLNPLNAAATIETLSESLDPLYLANNMRTKKKFREAVDFIIEVSLDRKDFDLLFLAAEIMHKDLRKPVEAIELYERAILAAPPGNWSGHFNQLGVLLEVAIVLETSGLQSNFMNKLDTMIWRDYTKLTQKSQETYVLQCAGYFATKGNFVYVQHILHRHMYDGNTFLWWKFRYTIAYAEALLGEAMENIQKLESAIRFLDSVKAALTKIMNLPPDDPNKRSFTVEELNSYGMQITHLNRQILEFSQNQKSHDRK